MRNIYIVDDETISNFITCKLLELEGLKNCVTEFTQPQKALEIISKDRDDPLIFLDLNMPKMNGFEFIEKLKKENNSFKVILLTSSNSKFDLEKSEKYPSIIRYLTKPLTREKFSELSDFLKKHCQP
ncbi:response regulator [Gramella sp. GC03-9]|uniref:Response regulator n=1 Tax=Christiangramia oceanisediminis TaxID=2920386 RepID=A0A9X2KZD2_9FLAO|nr:response regulator [Gramella oceanisediminis]MCP9201019.1 response regulator [Gramella oceanisediminis]